MPQVDNLGREIRETGEKAQTVTGFAVEQGTVDGSDESVKATLEDEERRRKAGTERAERVSEMMAPEPARTGTERAPVMGQPAAERTRE